MSEYQYYEFRAVDRPLSAEDRRALRALSTRADITSVSFVNSYEWGDFKGDPAELMERWFDLHLYLANWGTRRLMIRLPRRRVEGLGLERLLPPRGPAGLRAAGANLVLDIERDEIELDDEDDGRGWLASLGQLRADILQGDLRVFHLIWLLAAEEGAIGEEEREPMPGIAPSSGALEAFSVFFGLDAELMEAAGEPTAEPRTLGALRARAAALRDARERAEAAAAEAERRRRAAEAEEERRARLTRLAARGSAVWQQVEGEIALRNARSYDRAAALLSDLKALAEAEGRLDSFRDRLSELRERHAQKGRFLERLAGLL